MVSSARACRGIRRFISRGCLGRVIGGSSSTRRVTKHELRSYIRNSQAQRRPCMDELKGIYLYVFPVVIIAAITEGIVLSRSKHGFDWKSWACSLADQTGRQALSYFPLMLAAPVF